MSLTSRQKEVLDFIVSYIETNGLAPSLQDIASWFDLSVSTVHEHLTLLEDKGYIQRGHAEVRSIEVLKARDSVLTCPGIRKAAWRLLDELRRERVVVSNGTSEAASALEETLDKR